MSEPIQYTVRIVVEGGVVVDVHAPPNITIIIDDLDDDLEDGYEGRCPDCGQAVKPGITCWCGWNF